MGIAEVGGGTRLAVTQEEEEEEEEEEKPGVCGRGVSTWLPLWFQLPYFSGSGSHPPYLLSPQE